MQNMCLVILIGPVRTDLFFNKTFFCERYNMELIILKLHESDTKVWSFIDCHGIFCDLSLVLMNLDFINLIKKIK